MYLTSTLFRLVHVPSINMEEEGFITYTSLYMAENIRDETESSEHLSVRHSLLFEYLLG